jgi:hypothetical protein
MGVQIPLEASVEPVDLSRDVAVIWKRKTCLHDTL